MVESATATTTSTSTSTAQQVDFGKEKEMFLKLLVAQLKNQDPSSPMDQKEMLSQMAQFSTVEQMGNVAQTLQSMQSSNEFTRGVALIGKSVDYIDGMGGVTYNAQVTAVSQNKGETRLILGDGRSIGVNEVVTVK